MTSGIIQLVSNHKNSTPFLTGNPQITFFKSYLNHILIFILQK